MPEKRHHAHHLDFSFESPFLGTYTDEILAYCKHFPLWYAFKHELGENGKLHLHLVMVFEEIRRDNDPKKNGSMTASNCKAHVIRNCPTMQAYLAEHGSRHAICAHPCYSDRFIEYMQKEGELKYTKLPADICELQPYFADLLKNKPLSSDFEKWKAMYVKDLRLRPATFDSCWTFFGEHMYAAPYDIKVLSDKVKLDQRADAMVHYLNGTIPSMLAKRKREAIAPPDDYPECANKACRYLSTTGTALCTACTGSGSE